MAPFQPTLLVLGHPDVTAPWTEGRAGELTAEFVSVPDSGEFCAGPFTCLADYPVCIFLNEDDPHHCARALFTPSPL